MSKALKLLLKAARFAKKAHAGQKRAHGAPYFEHPKAVARILWEKGHREPELIAAAYLHDVVEDCEVSPPDLVKHFGLPVGLKIGGYVVSVTRVKGETYEAYCYRVKRAGPESIALKLADSDANKADLKHLPEGHPLHAKYAKKRALLEQIFSQ